VSKKDELVPALDTLEREYEAACRATGMANWDSYSHEGESNLDSAKAMFAKIFLDKGAAKMIETWRDKSGALADKLLARRLELWHRCFLGGAVYADPQIASLEDSLQKKITGFTFRYGGRTITRAQASNLLRKEPRQSERRKLWSVPSHVSASAADGLGRLVKLRNAKAASMKFANYYSLSLSLNAINEEWLNQTLNDLEEQTHAPFAQTWLVAVQSVVCDA